MTEAPLKNLSFLSMETIIGYMDARKLFEVSIKSESVNMSLGTIKVPVDEILLSVSENGFVHVYCCGSACLSFNLVPMQDAERAIPGRINGKPMTLYNSFRGGYDYSLETFTIVEMEDISSHLLRIFRPKKFDLHLTASSSAMNCLDWKMPLNTIFIRCTYKYVITREDLRRVFENESTKISLWFECLNSRGYGGILPNAIERKVLGQIRTSLLDIPKLIKCEKFECHVFDFISVEDLINSQCKIIDLTNQMNPMTNSELNRFLKAWKTGEHMTNLEEMFIHDPYETYNHTLEIREGIEMHDDYPTHPTYIKEYSDKFDRFDNKGGLVIKRETDNVLATIMIQRLEIKFVVWKDGEELE